MCNATTSDKSFFWIEKGEIEQDVNVYETIIEMARHSANENRLECIHVCSLCGFLLFWLCFISAITRRTKQLHS